MSNVTWLPLGMDVQGELLVLLSEYHTWLHEQWETGEITTPNMMDTVYLLGNIEGRLIGQGMRGGPVMMPQTDMELMDCWAKELAESKGNKEE